MCVGGEGLVQHSPLVLIRQTKLNEPVRAFHVAVTHKAGACGDTAPWDEPKDESQVHCPRRATGHVRDITAPFIKDESGSWGVWSAQTVRTEEPPFETYVQVEARTQEGVTQS